MALTIEDIITQKEGQTFDCKSVQIEPKALSVPIVAMANADGGTLAIGVSDKTRRIEGVDGNEKRLNDLLRVPLYRELNVNHTSEPKVHLDAFILKVTVRKNAVGLTENNEKVIEKVSEKVPDVTENNRKLIEKVSENADRVSEKNAEVLEKVLEKAEKVGDHLSDNRISILRIMISNPYVTRLEIAKVLGISLKSVGANITAMRGKYLNRVGPDKGGFWEVIIE